MAARFHNPLPPEKATPLAAFAAGILTVFIVYRIARVRGQISSQSMLLAGVVVGSLFWSLIPLLLTISHRYNEMSRILYVLLGSLSSADWQRLILLLPILMVTAIVLQTRARELDASALGEQAAAALGVNDTTLKKIVIGISAMAIAATVSTAGIIAFVGLIVPHIARTLVGSSHRSILPISMLLGASLLSASDFLVRVYFNDMPVGVITSIIGAPLFCILLRKTTH